MSLPEDIEAWMIARLTAARDADEIPGKAVGAAPAARVYVGQVEPTNLPAQEYRIAFEGFESEPQKTRGPTTLVNYSWIVNHSRHRHRPDLATVDTARSAGDVIGSLLNAQQHGAAPIRVISSTASQPATTFASDRQTESVRVTFRCRAEVPE